jgi:hypothetical protein
MRMLDYERHGDKLLPRRQFVRRLAMHALFVLGVAVISLGVGILGYHYLEGLPWLDAFLNAAMILGGMGPVSPLTTPGGKLFAGLYALYSGLVLLVMAGVLLAPVVHRLLHRFHLDVAEDNDAAEPADGPDHQQRPTPARTSQKAKRR